MADDADFAPMFREAPAQYVLQCALAFAVLDVGSLHVAVTVGAVILLAVVRRLLGRWLRDLV